MYCHNFSLYSIIKSICDDEDSCISRYIKYTENIFTKEDFFSTFSELSPYVFNFCARGINKKIFSVYNHSSIEYEDLDLESKLDLPENIDMIIDLEYFPDVNLELYGWSMFSESNEFTKFIDTCSKIPKQNIMAISIPKSSPIHITHTQIFIESFDIVKIIDKKDFFDKLGKKNKKIATKYNSRLTKYVDNPSEVV